MRELTRARARLRAACFVLALGLALAYLVRGDLERAATRAAAMSAEADQHDAHVEMLENRVNGALEALQRSQSRPVFVVEDRCDVVEEDHQCVLQVDHSGPHRFA